MFIFLAMAVARALGCAVNIFERSGVRAGDTVAIIGAGF